MKTQHPRRWRCGGDGDGMGGGGGGGGGLGRGCYDVYVTFNGWQPSCNFTSRSRGGNA